MRFAISAMLGVYLCACQSQRPAGTDAFESTAEAPALFRTKFETSQGAFIINIVRVWSPRGADRFHLLVTRGFYNEARFFRVVPGFVIQWGIHADPAEHLQWKAAEIVDDPPGVQSNAKGTISFATDGPNTRTTQVFINLVDNHRLDARGFTPFGRVTEGMEIVEKLFAGYGDEPPRGNGPPQAQITAQGNPYLLQNYPKLDYIRRASIVP